LRSGECFRWNFELGVPVEVLGYVKELLMCPGLELGDSNPREGLVQKTFGEIRLLLYDEKEALGL
jgi:hypothetical protein